DLGPRKPDFAAAGRPREPARGREVRRQGLRLAGPIHDENRSSIVANGWMVEEGHGFSVQRHAEIADPPVRLVEHLSDRVLDPALGPDGAHDRQRLPIRCPVGELDVLLDLTRRAAPCDSDPRERAAALEWSYVAAIQANGHLTGARDRKYV